MFLKRAILTFLVGLGLTFTSCGSVGNTLIKQENENVDLVSSPTLATELNPVEGIASPIIPSPAIVPDSYLGKTIPEPRTSHAMVYDPVRKVVVMFGGYSSLLNEDVGFYLNDTWEYDGLSWTKSETPISPSPRSGHVMAYDGKRNLIVLFGGGSEDDPFLNDTWEYNGTSWQQRNDLLSSPSQKRNATMSYDPRTETVLLFGGYAGYLTNDLWEYDGLTWKQIDSKIVETRLMYSPMFPKMVYGGEFGTVAFIEDSIFSYVFPKWEILSEPSINDENLDQTFIFTAI